MIRPAPFLLRAMLLTGAMTPWPANAQSMAADGVALTFQAAEARLEHASPALAGADHAVNAARETQAALATLRRPVVSASAQYLQYQKTFSVDLSDAKGDAVNGAQDLLAGLPATVPAPFQEIAAEITGRLSQALPGLFALVPDTLSYRYRETVFRPTVQAAMPLYTGGAIPAIERGAAAGTSLARAQADQAREVARINLIRVYFGQLAAQSLEASALQSRDALAKLYGDAVKLEQAGVTPRAVTLQAQVARDTAEGAYQRASLAHGSARGDLSEVLDMTGVRPTTPLFVDSRPLAPVASFLGRSGEGPQARQAAAGRDLAGAGVDLARSRYRPQAFAFGEYNLNRNNALPTEPDWIVGVGARITLLSNVDRGHLLAAAKEREAAAAATEAQARKAADAATARAWDLVEGARRSFLLLNSSIAAAEKNLRVQQVSFREGEATITAVLAAEAALSAARTQRIATAYEYDLALAGLLAASNRLEAFGDHLARADQRVLPEPVR
ncbi:Outer membrane protein TolC [Sphingomonas gellani]|uniref:Outer membrane protein TolC n=2 Tax=Sphingomonas gellani TaxID=1166340 RepID=A0A1H8AYD4_9SPHN|nr:Outer membrane protein TolC [Sphingomonas gellani]